MASRSQDTASILEVPGIRPGKYRLRLSIPKTNWLGTRDYETCLSFEFSLDFTALRLDRQEKNTINVLSVMPRAQRDIPLNSFLSLELNFGQKAALARLVRTLNEAA